MKKGTFKKIWYDIMCRPCQLFCVLCFGIRAFGVTNIPRKGGFLLVCNHQSFLDPMLTALPTARMCCFAARDSLFKIPAFGRLIHSVNAIPIKRGQPDLRAMRKCIERLKQGFGLVLYPEGTRTSDGKIGPLKPGFGLLARRAAVPIIPAVIDGAYECWPRHKKIFRPGKVTVNYAKPISYEEIAAMNDEELAKMLTDRLRKMQTEIRIKKGKLPFKYES